jgi:hypothetical protein
MQFGTNPLPGVTVYTARETEVMDAVAEALRNALQNGHDFKGWSDESIADDMIECGGIDNGEFSRADIIAAIKAQRS